uniref:ketoacyl-ACP synthase III n=1 Tax=Polynucleobacter sp. TaxID=2029855 RepID=UPI0040479CBE
MQNTYARFADISMYLPNKILTNAELASLYPDWPASKIFEKTGINERRISSDGETASDLAFEAATNLFQQGVVHPDDVDFLIFCTQAPDYILPTSACILQSRLKISRYSGALDINLGCSGYVYGLSLAKGLIETGAAKCVLLLTADTYSKFIHPLDKSVRTLFGDGASATAIVACDADHEKIGPFIFGTDGDGAKNLIVESGMFRMNRSAETAKEIVDSFGNVRSKDNLFMNGAEVMTFSLKEVPKAVEALLTKAGKGVENIDMFIMHQANKFMLEALRKKLKLDEAKMPILVENIGNTVSSTIPIALFQLFEQGKLKRGQKLMLVGFGVGYSWAACLVSF